jgi:hypothetical protein
MAWELKRRVRHITDAQSECYPLRFPRLRVGLVSLHE